MTQFSEVRKAKAKKETPPEFDWGSERLKTLHAFLKTHRQWNEDFQQREYKRCLQACASPRERLVHFLHWNVNTQQRADMNDLARFWALIATARDDQTNSPESLCALLKSSYELKPLQKWQLPLTPPTGSWDHLFWTLRRVPGWGEKTSALFVNACIRLHQKGPPSLHFWEKDTLESTATGTSKLYVPVDAVIKRIFEELTDKNLGFVQINNGLHAARWTADDMLIWDDLWFWGFLTQSSKAQTDDTNSEAKSKPNDKRYVVEWNEAKYWSNPSYSASSKSEMMKEARAFYNLLRQVKD